MVYVSAFASIILVNPHNICFYFSKRSWHATFSGLIFDDGGREEGEEEANGRLHFNFRFL
jgi:hypothetical protein